MSVLIVDDHEIVVRGLTALLQSEPDIQVAGTAVSVAEALQLVAELRPQVVVMDYALPDGDGATAAQALRAVQPSARVIILTGSDQPGALQAAAAAGCVGYLRKADPSVDLPSAIRTVAAGGITFTARDMDAIRTVSSKSWDLTARELEVLGLVGHGLSNQAIADRLVLSVNTVRTHVQSILGKLGAHSKLEAVVMARRRRILS